MLEGFRHESTVSDLCRREGIRPHSYHSWTKEFMEAGREKCTRDSVRDAPPGRKSNSSMGRTQGSSSWSAICPSGSIV